MAAARLVLSLDAARLLAVAGHVSHMVYRILASMRVTSEGGPFVTQPRKWPHSSKATSDILVNRHRFHPENSAIAIISSCPLSALQPGSRQLGYAKLSIHPGRSPALLCSN